MSRSAANFSPEPTAVVISVCAGAKRFAAPRLRRRPVSSALRPLCLPPSPRPPRLRVTVPPNPIFPICVHLRSRSLDFSALCSLSSLWLTFLAPSRCGHRQTSFMCDKLCPSHDKVYHAIQGRMKYQNTQRSNPKPAEPWKPPRLPHRTSSSPSRSRSIKLS